MGKVGDSSMISLKKIRSVMILTILSGCNSVFYFPMKEIAYRPAQFEVNSEDIVIETPDGEQLQGWRLPAKSDSKGVVVLQLHGNAENRSTHFLSAVWLLMNGVDVIAVDYRGYDGSTGEPSRSGVVVDAAAAMKWVEREYPHHKKFILGQSLGGAVAVAALAAPHAQDQWQGLILESTFYSYRGVARIKFSNSWLLWAFQWMPYLLLSGAENPIDAAPSIHLPVLAFHAVDDNVVPFESGKILYDELAKFTKVTFEELPGGGHAAAFAETKGIGRKMMRDFLGVQ